MVILEATGHLEIPLAETPPPPEDTNVIGIPHDIGPSRATFDKAVTICFSYDPGEVPDGVEEKDLVIAVWDEGADEGAGEWVDLEGCVVDTEAHRVCASVTHFTAFSVMAHTAPAVFSTESLVISPGEAEVGQIVTIVVTVTNLGDLEGSHEVVLELDGIPSDEVVVTLGGGESQEVSFSVSRDKGGPCRVNVDGQTGVFNVKEEVVVPELEEPAVEEEAPVLAPAAFVVSDLMIYPGEVEAGADVSISVKVVNIGELEGTHELKLKIGGIEVDSRDVHLTGGAGETVVFTVSEPVAGSHSVVVGDQAGEFTVSEKAPPVEEAAAAETASSTPWWLIGGVVGAVLVAAAAVWFTVLRRRI